ADPFYDAFHQDYTQDNPGILKHPRWGDINVFPFLWSQTEELIDGNRVSRIAVTFREVFPQGFPTTDARGLEVALLQLSEAELISGELAANIDVSTLEAISNVAGQMRDAVGIIVSHIQDAVEFAEDVIAAAEAIQSVIDDVLDGVLGGVVTLIAVTQRLIRLPGRIISQTRNKINGYKDMISDLCNSFNDESETSPVNRKNNAIMMQLIAGFGVGATSEAAAFTEDTIRSESIDSIEIINETAEIFTTFFEQARTSGNVKQEFSGDHNFFSLIQDTTKRINEILLNRAFDLKAEKRFILKSNSDAITLAYEHYGNVQPETMKLFIDTNRLTGEEFTEIPSGREIVIYG
ncbi:hypothetical protein KAR91_03695, partial [Candidatus Pacearchaeota archaeon]|nr:hypothetical protein [Candidatus Pacearchaeota archaeon]